MRRGMKLETLRKRREFLRTRGGGRWATPFFVVEAKARPAAGRVSQGEGEKPQQGGQQSGARFGFTVTKKIGNAVRRNRVRRRLKAAILRCLGDETCCIRADTDYVIIARDAAFGAAFDDLCAALSVAMGKVHQPRRNKTHVARNRRRSGKGQTNEGAGGD